MLYRCVYLFHRTSPIWGYVYKDLIAAQSELQKQQKIIQILMSKLEASFSFPPRVPSSNTYDSQFDIEIHSIAATATAHRIRDNKQKRKDDDIPSKEQLIDQNIKSELGAVQTSPLLFYSEDRMNELINEYIVCAHKFFPENSMMLLQTRISSLLLKNNLPKVICEASNFLFPCTFTDWSPRRYWSNLKATVQNISSPTFDRTARGEVGDVLHGVVSLVSSNGKSGCIDVLSYFDIQLLLDFIYRMYPPRMNGMTKTMLYYLDFHGYGLLSILGAIYVHFLLISKSEIAYSADDDSGIQMTYYLAWLSRINHNKAFRSGGSSGSESEEVESNTTDIFERNFEFRFNNDSVNKVVMVPESLKVFFVACNNGMVIAGSINFVADARYLSVFNIISYNFLYIEFDRRISPSIKFDTRLQFNNGKSQI